MKSFQTIPDKKGSYTEHPVNELIISRWSPRAFSSEYLSDDTLNSLFEAMRWAPSSMNAQPWRILFSRKGDDTFERIAQTLMDNNKIWAPQAQVLLLTLTKKTLPNGKINNSAKHDLGLAIGNLLLQATDMGIGVHQIGGFSRDQITKLLDVPDDLEPNTILALGYFGNPEQLSEPLRERELAARHRMPIEEFAYYDQFNKEEQ